MPPITRGARPRILVADDDDLLSEVLVSALIFHGHDAIRAPGGILSSDLIAEASLVILDARIPGVDFDTTYRELQRDGIEVLVITGEVTPPAGVPAEHYLGKPVDLRDLLSAVSRLVNPTPAR